SLRIQPGKVLSGIPTATRLRRSPREVIARLVRERGGCRRVGPREVVVLFAGGRGRRCLVGERGTTGGLARGGLVGVRADGLGARMRGCCGGGIQSRVAVGGGGWLAWGWGGGVVRRSMVMPESVVVRVRMGGWRSARSRVSSGAGPGASPGARWGVGSG